MDLNRKPSRDDREDEYNESRLFVQRGINERGIETPTEDGSSDDPENLSEISSIGREQPGNKRDPESEIADKSPLYGQGFGAGQHGDLVAQRKAQTGVDPHTGQDPIQKDGPTSVSGQGPTREPRVS
jgi:hypothetical protein